MSARPDFSRSPVPRLAAALALTAVAAIAVSMISDASEALISGQTARTTYASNLGQAINASVDWASINQAALKFDTGTISSPCIAASGPGVVTIRQVQSDSVPATGNTIEPYRASTEGNDPDALLTFSPDHALTRPTRTWAVDCQEST